MLLLLLVVLVVKRNVNKPFSDVTVGRMEEGRKSARVTNGAEVSCMSVERRVIGKIKRGGVNKETSELRGRGRVRQRMKRSRRYCRN